MADVKVVRTCVDCGAEFELTTNESNWYAEKGWELPKRCKDCRAAKKQKNAERKPKKEE